jgi:hypothetical protein
LLSRATRYGTSQGRRVVLYCSWASGTWEREGSQAYAYKPPGVPKGQYQLVYDTKGQYVLTESSPANTYSRRQTRRARRSGGRPSKPSKSRPWRRTLWLEWRAREQRDGERPGSHGGHVGGAAEVDRPTELQRFQRFQLDPPSFASFPFLSWSICPIEVRKGRHFSWPTQHLRVSWCACARRAGQRGGGRPPRSQTICVSCLISRSAAVRLSYTGAPPRDGT